MPNEQPPKILYQYRPPEAWALDNLCRQVMYFGSPENFNDPYDCRTPPTFRDSTAEQLVNALKKGKFPAKSLPNVRGLLGKDALKSEVIRHANAMLRREYTKLREQYGVACFSMHRDNLLMWSQYGGHGKGFCLAFDVRDKLLFPAGKIIPVQYSAGWPDVGDTMKMLDQKINPREFLAHKSKDWAYEQEWRLLGERKSEKRYDAKTLKAVYFGTEATKGTREIVRLIVQEKYPHTELWNCKIHASECRVDFDLISRADNLSAAPTARD